MPYAFTESPNVCLKVNTGFIMSNAGRIGTTRSEKPTHGGAPINHVILEQV